MSHSEERIVTAETRGALVLHCDTCGRPAESVGVANVDGGTKYFIKCHGIEVVIWLVGDGSHHTRRIAELFRRHNAELQRIGPLLTERNCNGALGDALKQVAVQHPDQFL